MGSVTKILIANRGEIACRIIRSARKMGIKTVAVYSEADAGTLHVKQADEAVPIGPGPAAESYLLIEKIIDACRSTGADAVHPGYGFLSENPAFARACEKAGITFIGPKADSMEAMGLKDAAKKLMSKAGVPITPGYHGEDQAIEFLQAQADQIGYPVLIKAVAGGGGKGMRKVEEAADFSAALESCQREAAASFGDDRVLIEKYITSPRHIEVQVFGDSHGNLVHMYERDCSLQRRHQKIIEEAPAPGMTAEVRTAMTGAAIQAARAVDYVGAGTVEFIVDGSGPLRTDGFWFMEMNTRLQVEHPVTEEITGLDLVEWQIRVARGEALPQQSDISISGYAMEARVYAEDPLEDFLPSVGPVEIFTLPDGVRVDSGIEEGGEVSVYYDPMIAKMIVHKETRLAAIDALEVGCRNTHIFPIKTNLRFMVACLSNTDFRAETISTHFISKNAATLLPENFLDQDLASLSAALLAKGALPEQVGTPYHDLAGWRLNQPARSHYFARLAGETTRFELSPSQTQLSEHFARYSVPQGEVVFVDGLAYLIETHTEDDDGASSGNAVIAPMPGKILDVNVKVGDVVTAGDTLVVMEAMKMELTLQAPRNGVVASVNAEEGALVAGDALLFELEQEQETS